MLFRLRTPHIIGGAERQAGTIVGPYGSVMENGPAVLLFEGDPTPDMEGVDDEGKSKVNEVFNRLHGSDAPWHMERPEPGRPPRPGQEAAPERPYHDDHPDYAEVDQEEQDRRNEEMQEANRRNWASHGTAPAQTLPRPGASVTAVRPMMAETPQDQAVRPDRPLAQQLPDAQPGAAQGSPNAEQAKREADAREKTRQEAVAREQAGRRGPPAPQNKE
jgi:hypothetical protein